MKVHILDDWFDTLRGLPSFERLAGHDVTVWTDHVEDVETLARRLRDAEVLVLFRERTSVTRDLLERLANLRLISQRGAYPHVDVEACTAHDVVFCSKIPSGGGTNYAAAEVTWALIMVGMRDLFGQMQSAKAGHWQAGIGKTLRGRRLGLYGYGRIARAVAGYAAAFGMDVVWWAFEDGRARAMADGATLAASHEDFFAQSDVVSLHVRLTEASRGIITTKELTAMQPGALLVNTSRAGLIKPGALLTALNAGRPGKAAVDVFDHEPVSDPEDPLLSHPNLIATPHIGFVTEDEFEKQFSDVFDQVAAFARGEPIHMINPEIWSNK